MKDFVNETKQHKLKPDNINSVLEKNGTSGIQFGTTFYNLLKRPQLELESLAMDIPRIKEYYEKYDKEFLESALIQIKYEDYIEKEAMMADKMSQMEDLFIKDDFNYDQLSSMSYEAREKLKKHKPKSLGQASRISGVTPADISVMMIYLGK